MANLTLLDVAKLNGNDKVVGLIEENLSFAPELTVFPVRSVKGTSYTTLKRTGLPATGFRSANGGITPSKSIFEKQLHECYIFGGAVQVDKAVGMAHEDGLAALEMLEASGVARSALINLGAQVWDGVSKDGKGFPGIKSFTVKGSALTLDVGGTTAGTASSVYGVKFGNQDATLVVGNNTTLELDPFMDQQLVDANGGAYAARVSSLTGWIGLQISNANCVGRMLNITADSGKTLTDALISQWLEKFPVGYRPDALFMSRRSAGQLQRSRSVTIMSGAGGKATGAVENVAPWPVSAFDIPIIVSDSIGNTDALE